VSDSGKCAVSMPERQTRSAQWWAGTRLGTKEASSRNLQGPRESGGRLIRQRQRRTTNPDVAGVQRNRYFEAMLGGENKEGKLQKARKNAFLFMSIWSKGPAPVDVSLRKEGGRISSF